MKLQKLVYYSQAWALVWDEEPLFTERVEAWANGPVVPDLYREHKGLFKVRTWPRGAPRLGRQAARDHRCRSGLLRRSNLPVVERSHPPGGALAARPQGTGAGGPRSKEISHAAMAEYYGSLV